MFVIDPLISVETAAAALARNRWMVTAMPLSNFWTARGVTPVRTARRKPKGMSKNRPPL